MLALVAHRRTGTNELLAERGATIVTPRAAMRTLGHGDVALARLDVRPSLDGIEPGLWSLRRLGRQGQQLRDEPGSASRARSPRS